jgi:hypothetical protein
MIFFFYTQMKFIEPYSIGEMTCSHGRITMAHGVDCFIVKLNDIMIVSCM